MPIDFESVVPIERMSGDDDEDTALLRQLFAEAESYLRGFSWCRDIRKAYFGIGVGGLFAVFLFHLDPDHPQVDEWLWVVVGDLPSAYLVTDEAPDPVSALRVYCSLMDEWVAAVRTGTSLDDVVPVASQPTLENANELAKRTAFLRSEVIPTF